MIQTQYMTHMIYPSATVAPSVETLFVNGVKFDICEVIEECYGYLYEKKARYFVCVEDTHIVNYTAAETYHAATGEVRWDFFCTTKGDCLNMVKDYEGQCAKIERLTQKFGKSPMILPKISEANNYCLRRYGVKAA